MAPVMMTLGVRMASGKRCGNCELLERSTTPGLSTFGKCPHRDGWVRVESAPCELHQGEPKGALVRVIMGLNILVASVGASFAVWVSVRHGNALTNLLLVAAGVAVVTFAWYVRRRGLFAEEAKFQILDRQELPPEEDRTPPPF